MDGKLAAQRFRNPLQSTYGRIGDAPFNLGESLNK